MTVTEIITNLLLMLSGLGIFMYGLKTMSDMLEMGASDKLRQLFGKVTNNKFKGISVGIGITGIIQSSSATTVMVVGLVNAGMLDLYQASSIIMGANIGTTITGLIISLKSLPVSPFLAAISSIGIFMVMFSKDPKIKNVGSIMLGLGLIFGGLIVMGNAMGDFAELESVQNFFIATDNPFILLLMGLLLTAIIQSSSATTGIIITMGSAGLLGIDSAIFIVLGINIGTCITVLLACIGTSTNAKRAAMIHLMFNVIGSVTFFILLLITPIRSFIINLLPGGVEYQIAIFHLLFNIATTLLLVGFTNLMVKFTKKIIPDKIEDNQNDNLELKMKYINEVILDTPAIAISQVKNEILYMSSLAAKNLEMSVEDITKPTLDRKKEFYNREELINYLNREITHYLVKISSLDISFRDEVIIGTYYHVVSDIERIGDYAENIINYTERLIEESTSFSEEANGEILEMFNVITELNSLVVKAFSHEDLINLKDALILEDKVDDYKRTLSLRHIKRLNDGICTPVTGAVFLSLISNLERIADHMVNICNSIKDYAKKQKFEIAEPVKN
jgi:phosphate:Na+ symporter